MGKEGLTDSPPTGANLAGKQNVLPLGRALKDTISKMLSQNSFFSRSKSYFYFLIRSPFVSKINLQAEGGEKDS